MPEAKNIPPTTAKDMKAMAVFQHRLRASITRAMISNIPEIRSFRSMVIPPIALFRRLPKFDLIKFVDRMKGVVTAAGRTRKLV
jgi:hypothetical protein